MSNLTQELKVLLVGDWIVDENWIVVEHDSDTSTHIGQIHYRSLVDQVDAQILNLCGAGHVARSLYGLAGNHSGQPWANGQSLQLYCLGLWHHEDTPLLESMFTNETIIGQTPLTILGLKRIGSEETSGQKNSRCCLRTLAQENWSPKCGTTRVNRLYKILADGDPVILHRVDWQTRHTPNYHDLSVANLREYLWEDQMSAIVAYDLHKGCIHENLVDALLSRYPNAGWYVRTKKLNVEWINKIPEQNLRLRFIGADYIPSRSKTKRWFYGSKPSREALEELQSWGLFRQIKLQQTDRWVVALHSDNKIIALHSRNSDRTVDGYILAGSSTPQSVSVGRSSTVFASCVASLLQCYDDNQPETMLRRASIHATKWTKQYTDLIRSAQFQSDTNSSVGGPLVCNFSDAIRDNSQGVASMGLSVSRFNLKREIDSWNDSFTQLGIVEESDPTSGTQKKVFHLWRGHSSIPGYIAIRDHLREDLNGLYQTIQDFKSKRKTASLNCLILGAPGWGKTFLAGKLGEVFDFNLLFFNLAQLTSLEQVIDCFDSISSLQNQQKRRPVLAFFDEIDSKLDGQYAFSMFLSPMLDGTYRRGGRIFYLAPCVWLFAGAIDPSLIEGADKTPDFMSRINGPTIRLDFGEKSRDPKSMTEQVYLGVQLLQDNFSDVYRVSDYVLDFFHRLGMKHGVRSLEQVIRKFRNVQYGQVGQSNLPEYNEISSLIEIDQNAYGQIRSGRREKEFIQIIKAPLDNLGDNL